MENYWINEALKAAVLLATAFFLGLWVIKRGVRVNYTRKIFHFVLFFFPTYLYYRFPFHASLYAVAMSGVMLLACIGIMVGPLRKRSVFLATAFASIDRPEDRPYTLLWLSTQILATYAVIISMLIWLSTYEKQALIFISVLIVGIGDGLAEPVGVRFGRRKYHVRALFTDRIYTRSIEGSLCVFASGILALLLLQEHLVSQQLILALLIIPAVTTLAEAVSPHTWDGPFLYLAGGISTIAVLEISQFLN